MMGKFIQGIGALIKGLGVTLKYFFKRPVTQRYPEQKREPFLRYRGAHVLRRDEKGKERCVACFLCATVCPANVITIEAGERDDKQKYPKRFEVDMGRCVFCGYCVEACPKSAIVMGKGYELADYRRDDLVYEKEKLLEPPK